MDLLLMFFTNPIAPVVVLVVVLIIYILVIRNRFVRLDNKVKQSKSGIDVFLTKRFELIPNLVETVKGYMLHEEKVLESLTEKRSVYLQNKDLGVGKDLNENMKSVFAIAEKYPELKASENFLDLQKALKETESDIEAARRLYNSDVTMFNNYLDTFPYSMFKNLFGYNKKYDLFEASKEARNNINVNM
jgi:LemA protein